MRWIFVGDVLVQITVPESINVLCSNTFNLTAQTDRPASIKWTQVQGPTTVILDDTSLNTVVERGSSPGPFRFRITANNRNFREVPVFTVPTSLSRIGDFADTSTLGTISGVNIAPSGIEQGYLINGLTPLKIQWSPPNINGPLVETYTIYTFLEGSLSQESLPSPDRFFYPIELGTVYYIKTRFRRGDSGYFETLSGPFSIPPANAPHLDSSSRIGSHSLSNDFFSRTIPSNIERSGEDQNMMGALSSTVGLFTRLEFSSIARDASDNNYVGSLSLTVGSFTRQDLNGTTLG
jgi:hypothetical protein